MGTGEEDEVPAGEDECVVGEDIDAVEEIDAALEIDAGMSE